MLLTFKIQLGIRVAESQLSGSAKGSIRISPSVVPVNHLTVTTSITTSIICHHYHTIRTRLIFDAKKLCC